jgi:hypothetical protein
MPKQIPDPRQVEIDALRAELAAAKAAAATASVKRITFRVSEKGAVSVYGLGRWPTTLYRSQWEALADALPALRSFISENAGRLASKE